MSGSRRHVRAGALVGGLLGAVLVVPVPVASAQSAPVPAGTSVEGWFRTLPVTIPNAPVCPPVGGCLPAVPEIVPPSPYAPGTLHVGVGGGAEESRTYLSLDLSAVPFDSQLVGGTLTLPLATDPQAGTVLPETAALRACLVVGSVPEADGAINGAPEADCETSSPATYRAADGVQPAAFTVDLAPFAEEWAIGTASLALVPAAEQAEGATWHAAFSRRDRSAAGATPISAEFLTGAADDSTGDAPDPADSVSVSVEGSTTGGLASGSLPPLDAGTSFAAPALAGGVADPLTAPVAPDVAAPQATVPVAAVLGGPFAYPAVFLLPLLLAAAVGWLGRALTRDLLPATR